MKKVTKTHTIPENSIIAKDFNDYDYCDSFSVVTQSNDSLDRITTTIFQTPKWADLLMGVRNSVFSLFGLDKGGFKEHTNIAEHYPIGSRAVYFTVINRNDNEIVTQEVDKHLDFRISIFENREVR